MPKRPVITTYGSRALELRHSISLRISLRIPLRGRSRRLQLLGDVAIRVLVGERLDPGLEVLAQ